MCRYAFSGPYKEKWACFKCRKSFKQTNRDELAQPMRVAPDGERLALCPSCKSPMHDMGLDFRAPKQSDVKQWKKVEQLHSSGFTYHSCGCGPGFRPAKLKDVKSFLEEQRLAAEKRKRAQLRVKVAEAKLKRSQRRNSSKSERSAQLTS